MKPSIDILVPASASVVDTWYGRTQSAVDGMPPHITLLWPWVGAPVPSATIERVRAATEGLTPFVLRLGEVGRFPGVVYLAPSLADGWTT